MATTNDEFELTQDQENIFGYIDAQHPEGAGGEEVFRIYGEHTGLADDLLYLLEKGLITYDSQANVYHSTENVEDAVLHKLKINVLSRLSATGESGMARADLYASLPSDSKLEDLLKELHEDGLIDIDNHNKRHYITTAGEQLLPLYRGLNEATGAQVSGTNVWGGVVAGVVVLFGLLYFALGPTPQRVTTDRQLREALQPGGALSQWDSVIRQLETKNRDQIFGPIDSLNLAPIE